MFNSWSNILNEKRRSSAVTACSSSRSRSRSRSSSSSSRLIYIGIAGFTQPDPNSYKKHRPSTIRLNAAFKLYVYVRLQRGGDCSTRRRHDGIRLYCCCCCWMEALSIRIAQNELVESPCLLYIYIHTYIHTYIIYIYIHTYIYIYIYIFSPSPDRVLCISIQYDTSMNYMFLPGVIGSVILCAKEHPYLLNWWYTCFACGCLIFKLQATEW